MFFFTSLTSFPSVQKSCLRFRCDQGSQICCESLIEFDRLRPFPVIHRLSSIFFVALEFVTVRHSSIESSAVPASLDLAQTRSSKKAKQRSGSPPVAANQRRGWDLLNLFHDVKDRSRCNTSQNRNSARTFNRQF